MKLSITDRVTADGKPTGNVDYWMWCPGCDDAIRIDNTWQVDGNMEKPTFSPSILSRGKYKDQDTVCHSFLRDGMWQFLGDCTHALVGQTVPMVELPDWLADKA